MNRLANGHVNGKLRFSAQDWRGPSTGDKGGVYWTSVKTGEKVYQTSNPGGQETAAKPETQVKPAGKTIDLKATGQKYAQIAREKWGDKAHEKLAEKAKALQADPSPEAKRKLEAVNAMMDHLTPKDAGKTGNVSSSDKPAESNVPKKPSFKPNKTWFREVADEIRSGKSTVDEVIADFRDGAFDYATPFPSASWAANKVYDEVESRADNDGMIDGEHWEDVAEEEVKKRYNFEAMIKSELGRLMSHQGDKIPGGKADSIPASSFPPEKVAQGTKVESEHTSDPSKAAEIARDHLSEDGNYYDKLAKMEAKPKNPKKATFVDKEGVGRTQEDYAKAKSDGRIPADLDFGTFQKAKMPLPPVGTHSDQKQKKEPAKDMHSAASDIGVKIYTPKDGSFKDQLYDIGRVDTKYLDDNYDKLGLHHNESLRYLGQVYNNAKDAGLSKEQVQKKIDGVKKVINDTANAIREKGASMGIEDAIKVADFYATHGIAMADKAQEELLGKPRQSSMDYDGDEPQRYEAISLDELRRMPGPEATAYAKGVLAMLQRRPDLRKEFSLQDIAYLEMISRDVDRYSAGEPELEWDDPFEHVPNKD